MFTTALLFQRSAQQAICCDHSQEAYWDIVISAAPNAPRRFGSARSLIGRFVLVAVHPNYLV